MQQFIKNLRNNKKQLFLMIAAIAFLMIGGTVALLSAVTGTMVNAFDGGHVNVSVIETGGDKTQDLENPGNADENVNHYTEMTADNPTVSKTVAIKNLDKPDYKTVDTYVRVRLVPILRYNDGTEYAGQVVPVDMAGKVNYTFGTDSKWVVDHSGGESYYYYTEAVTPGSTTTNLITAVTYTGKLPENTHFELQVLTEGIAAGQKDADGNSSLKGAWGIDDFSGMASVVTSETAVNIE
ncbi:hypothetical protein [Eubacterium barkeri]|uniref:SipW-cognate class signal peptide n=1 Tax=Eubacterium barkeri TaxID=1528 RepID=A0A1H3GLT8_EUBBA|nr:hypothetical protein [Eubacterium barkeri]SDY04067.1 hypothetical protein SAMN04488579_11442 [Eubacterium barkeri]